jgi:hypothetical protein
MRWGFLFSALAGTFLLVSVPLQAETTNDPVRHAGQLLDLLETEGAKAFSTAVAEALDNNSAAVAIDGLVGPIEKRKAKFRGVALDRNYGNAVRDVIIYEYMRAEQFPFLYFRFVYKMTDTGWRMTHASFDTEAPMPFPPKYKID